MGSRHPYSKRIACLQFAPELGKLEANITRADNLLRIWATDAIDWLLLPELAFSGYNFPDLAAIMPYLEPTTAGPTTKWAIGTAKRYGCHVTVGYPEICYPTSPTTGKPNENPNAEGVKRYNSTVTVSPTGDILFNYRKCHLYYTDDTWAHEGPGVPDSPFWHGNLGHVGQVSHAICMDINPYKFEQERYAKYEFATAVQAAGSKIMGLSTAWLTHLTKDELAEKGTPDVATLYYWIERFTPIVAASEEAAAIATAGSSEGVVTTLNNGSDDARETILVFANRCGSEGESSYAGTSCVLRIKDGKIEVLDILGRAEEGLLIVDTVQVGKFNIPPGREARQQELLKMIPPDYATNLALHMGLKDW